MSTADTDTDTDTESLRRMTAYPYGYVIVAHDVPLFLSFLHNIDVLRVYDASVLQPYVSQIELFIITHLTYIANVEWSDIHTYMYDLYDSWYRLLMWYSTSSMPPMYTYHYMRISHPVEYMSKYFVRDIDMLLSCPLTPYTAVRIMDICFYEHRYNMTPDMFRSVICRCISGGSDPLYIFTHACAGGLTFYERDTTRTLHDYMYCLYNVLDRISESYIHMHIIAYIGLHSSYIDHRYEHMQYLTTCTNAMQ
jgi:hypothetical protein